MKIFLNNCFSWLREKVIQLLFMAIFLGIVYLISHYNVISALFTVIIGNVLINYFWKFNIVAKKNIFVEDFKQKCKIFNSDYYDLYWEFNK